MGQAFPRKEHPGICFSGFPPPTQTFEGRLQQESTPRPERESISREKRLILDSPSRSEEYEGIPQAGISHLTWLSQKRRLFVD